MIDLTLVVVAKNEEDMRKFNKAHVDICDPLVLFVNVKRSPLAQIANVALDSTMKHRGRGNRVFGLCHADMEFGPGSLQAFYDCAIQGAVCGACGRNMIFADAFVGPGDSSYVWSKDWGRPTDRQKAAGYPAYPVPDWVRVDEFGAAHMKPCPVSTLDSSCIFFPTNLALRFDEQTFDGFHLHGEDICLQAHAKGIPVLVPAANAWHACPDVNGPNWGAERDRYKLKLDAKWKGRFPDYVTT